MSKCQDFFLEVLPAGEGLKILGTKVTLDGHISKEISNWIAARWAKFHSLKALLTAKGASLKKRLRLFDSTVGCSVLWCCESWALREEDKQQLRTAFHHMLRIVVNIKRAPNEDYIHWIQRVTRKARRLADEAGVRNWLQYQARAQWRWAGHVGRRSAQTWLWRTSIWRNKEWELQVMGPKPVRSRTGPWTRWENWVSRYCAENGHGMWFKASATKEAWEHEAEHFIKFCQVWSSIAFLQSLSYTEF